VNIDRMRAQVERSDVAEDWSFAPWRLQVGDYVQWSITTFDGERLTAGRLITNPGDVPH
jgi:hypothetical protein